jgi:hypothetical protein
LRESAKGVAQRSPTARRNRMVFGVDDHEYGPLPVEDDHLLVTCYRLTCPKWNPHFLGPDRRHSNMLARMYESLRNYTQ